MKAFLRVWLSISLIAIGLGIGLLILAAVFGVRPGDRETFSYSDSFENVEKLDIDISIGEVKIIKGDQFTITGDNLPGDGLEAYVKDGTWIIREKYENYMDFFGVELPINHIFSWNEFSTPKLEITIPENFVAENINMHIAAGDVIAEEIIAENGNFEVDAGRLKIEKLEVSGSSQYTIGTGTMILQNSIINDINVDCGVGNVEIYGKVTGDNDISCGVGRVVMELTGERYDYSYTVDYGIGNINVEGYDFKDNETIRNEAAPYKMNLDCGVGSIDVEFN